MKNYILKSICTVLFLLIAGSVGISKPTNRFFMEKYNTPFSAQSVNADLRLINFKGNRKYRDFVNLMQQLEMKQRKIDQATARILFATHGYFENDPLRTYYERANIRVAMLEYKKTSKEMEQILSVIETLLNRAGPSSSRIVRLSSQTQTHKVIRAIACTKMPCDVWDNTEKTIEEAFARQASDMNKIFSSRVDHFIKHVYNDVYTDVDHKAVCHDNVGDVCWDASGGSSCDNLPTSVKPDVFVNLSGLKGGDPQGAACLTDGCRPDWTGNTYFTGQYVWNPPFTWTYGYFGCGGNRARCTVDGLYNFLETKVAARAVQVAKAVAMTGTWHSIKGPLQKLIPIDVHWGSIKIRRGGASQNRFAKAAYRGTAGKGAIILATDATGNYVLYSAPLIGDQVTFNLPVGKLSGVAVIADQYAVSFENLEIKENKQVEMNTEACSDCGDIDFTPYSSDINFLYDCDGHCPNCTSCRENQWIGKFEGSVTARQPCDGGGVFTINGDFAVDFLLDDIKESDLPGGPVQDPEAYHFMNIPSARAKVSWKNFTHRTCPKSCVIQFAKTAPSFEFWTAWDWRVQNDKFVGIDLRFQQLKENTPTYCGPDKMNDFNIYSAGIMALPMADPDKYVPRNDDVIQRTWTDDKGPVKMKLKMRLEKKRRIP